MELVGFFRGLLHRKAVVAAILGLAAFAALLTAYKISPGGVQQRSLAVGAATSQILVDSSESTLVEGAGTDEIAALGTRAAIYAQYLSSRDAVDQIGRLIHVNPSLITAHGPFSQGTGIQAYQQQGAESRATDLVNEGKGYRLLFVAQEGVPIITVFATGPDTKSALALAHSSFTVLSRYIVDLKRQATRSAKLNPEPQPTATTDVPQVTNIIVRELGSPEGGLVGGGADFVLMVLAFLVVVGLGCVVFAAVTGFMRHWRLAGEMEEGPARLPLHEAEADEPARHRRARHPGARSPRNTEHESEPAATSP